MEEIDELIRVLTKQEDSPQLENQYLGESPEARIRRQNLRRYLLQMQARKPGILLLGEAAGYKGCGITGIPFTSERVMASNPFFKDAEFQCLHADAALVSEISATIVWGVLDKCQVLPLLWNIFPFHPHRTGNKQSNRTPDRDELEKGVFYVQLLLRIFPVKKIVALGRKAESKLRDLGLEPDYVRHPANGGKRRFEKGIKNILL